MRDCRYGSCRWRVIRRRWSRRRLSFPFLASSCLAALARRNDKNPDQISLCDDGLYQVAGVVYVVAFVDGHVVGEELQRDYLDDGQEQFGDGGDVENLIG